MLANTAATPPSIFAYSPLTSLISSVNLSLIVVFVRLRALTRASLPPSRPCIYLILTVICSLALPCTSHHVSAVLLMLLHQQFRLEQIIFKDSWTSKISTFRRPHFTHNQGPCKITQARRGFSRCRCLSQFLCVFLFPTRTFAYHASHQSLCSV